MKLRNRIFFDFFMLLVFVALQMNDATGNAVHEILGAAIVILVVIHCLINRKWIMNLRKAKKSRLIINFALLAVFFVAIFSGMMQSDFLLGQAKAGDTERWFHMHAVSTRVMIAIGLLHILIHRKMIAAAFRRRK